MGILAFILLCVVVGVVVWAAIRFVPMPAEFKTFLPAAAIILLVLLLLYIVLGGTHDVRIPQLR